MDHLSDDDALFASMRAHLFTAVVGDILDRMGYLHQFLPPEIRPLRDDMVAIGRAMPVLEADFFMTAEAGGHGEFAAKPFGLLFRALDSLKPNEIYIATGASPRYALWGELMSVRALQLKAAGAILDGYCRDSAAILQLNFPTFCYGSYAQDQAPRGKVVDFAVPIEIGAVRIRPGDIVFGDRDGVLVIPREAEKEAIALALEKVVTENSVRKAIEAGMSTEEAFRKYGVM
jgi:regulator of RNase E activity RraA